MSAIFDWGDHGEAMPSDFSSDELADEREVVVTAFPEESSRPAWQAALGDLVAKLEDLRSAVELIVLSVLPFARSGDDAKSPDLNEDLWSNDRADPRPVEFRAEPE